MRMTRLLLFGLLATCLMPLLTACADRGSTRPDVVQTTHVLDAPVVQYVAIPANLLAHPALAPLPLPGYRAPMAVSRTTSFSTCSTLRSTHAAGALTSSTPSVDCPS